VFWNDALPYFSTIAHENTLTPAKRFGDRNSTYPICMLVQYPQFFSNVTRDDFLDNKNGSYYTLWQTLRDCAKSATSSGTNAIWYCNACVVLLSLQVVCDVLSITRDITDKDFKFATSSRIEDTGTTQQYLHTAITVHMPCFVACGVAKLTEDYIEAVCRWSTGAVELLWSTLFSPRIVDFLVFAALVLLCGLACFHSSGFWYFLWVAVLLVVAFLVSG
jgi:hypothetical protein